MKMEPTPSAMPSAIEDEAKKRQERRERAIRNLIPAKKGEIRNPRGRPKKDLQLADLARQHAEKAINTLVEVMGNADASPSARVSAASELLDRGFGRAPQSLDVTATLSLSEEFERLVRRLSGGESARVIEHDPQ